MLSAGPRAAAARPATGLRHLCEEAAQRGIPAHVTLAGTTLDGTALAARSATVTFDDEIRAVRNTITAGADPEELGLAVGARASLTGLGLFGFAAMSSGTLRELITITLRYFTLASLHVGVGLTESGGRAVVTFEVEHLPPDVRRFFLAANAAGMVTVVPPFAISAFEAHSEQIAVRFAPEDRPSVEPLLAALPIGDVTFDAGVRRIEMPVAALDEPLPQADPGTLETCLAECEQLLERYERRVGVASQVRSHIVAGAMTDGGIDRVAAAMYVHPRTLRRRLAAEGTSYRALLEETRRAMAVELIGQVGLTVEEVARRLGYAETASFTHAFVRWFGAPPTALRRGGAAGFPEASG